MSAPWFHVPVTHCGPVDGSLCSAATDHQTVYCVPQASEYRQPTTAYFVCRGQQTRVTARQRHESSIETISYTRRLAHM